MRMIFNVFKKREDVLLWWRPHPLIKPSLRSLAPELLGAYEELEKEYVLERIGIYDEGADGNLAVASTDAFIGDYSSMIQMFGVVGKPIFWMDDHVLAERGEHGGLPGIGNFEVDEGGNLLFVSSVYNVLCRLDIESGEIHVLDENSYRDYCREHRNPAAGAKIPEPIASALKNNTWAEDFPEGFLPYLNGYVVPGAQVFTHVVEMEDGVYLFPGTANQILKYDPDTREIRTCDWELPYLEGQRKGVGFVGWNNYTCAKKYDDHTIVAVTAYDGRILFLDTRSLAVRMYKGELSQADLERFGKSVWQRAVYWGANPPYVIPEDAAACCIEDFLDALTGAQEWDRERQRHVYDGRVSNVDGSCGLHIHRTVMDKIVKGDKSC
jgi:hypothetical protein